VEAEVSSEDVDDNGMSMTSGFNFRAIDEPNDDGNRTHRRAEQGGGGGRVAGLEGNAMCW
jgi:hypothetical protein